MPVERELLSSAEAAEILGGVHPDTWDKLASEQGEWLHPVYITEGKRRVKRWQREDVQALKRIVIGRSRPRPPEDAAAEE